MFKIKKIMSLALACSMVLSMGATVSAEDQESSNFNMTANTDDGQSMYEINDEFVIIDSISYPINNNCIVYDGITYEIEGFNLVSYDEYNAKLIFPLPIEETEITDENQIRLLNEELLRSSLLRSNVTLPYYANVPSGQWYTETPVFNLISNTFYYRTVLTFSDMPLLATKKFTVSFNYYSNVTEKWYTSSTVSYKDVSVFNYIKFVNTSAMTYGKFYIANLYDDFAYKYTISLANS